MNTEILTKTLTKTRRAVWHYLMNNIDSENWSALKRIYNRLSDDLERLKQMKALMEEMDRMHANNIVAIKTLRKLKRAWFWRKFRLLLKKLKLNLK